MQKENTFKGKKERIPTGKKSFLNASFREESLCPCGPSRTPEAWSPQHSGRELGLLQEKRRKAPLTRSGGSPGGGHGHPLQYSCLENPMDRGAWGATVCGSQRVRQLNNFHFSTSHRRFLPTEFRFTDPGQPGRYEW